MKKISPYDCEALFHYYESIRAERIKEEEAPERIAFVTGRLSFLLDLMEGNIWGDIFKARSYMREVFENGAKLEHGADGEDPGHGEIEGSPTL